MQAGKNVASSVKESAANTAASAKAGMEKTKANVQEKAERATTRDPLKKDLATEKKEERITQAEFNKQEELDRHAQERQAASTGGPFTHSTTGATAHPTGMHQMSALPGHGTGEPTGRVTEGVVGSHPAAGTGHTTADKNPNVGAGTDKVYGTGGAYR